MKQTGLTKVAWQVPGYARKACDPGQWDWTGMPCGLRAPEPGGDAGLRKHCGLSMGLHGAVEDLTICVESQHSVCGRSCVRLRQRNLKVQASLSYIGRFCLTTPPITTTTTQKQDEEEEEEEVVNQKHRHSGSYSRIQNVEAAL